MKHPLENLDGLSDGALPVALELRRLGVGVMADRGELFIFRTDRLPAGFVARLRPHEAEIARFIERQDTQRRGPRQ